MKRLAGTTLLPSVVMAFPFVPIADMINAMSLKEAKGLNVVLKPVIRSSALQ